MRARLYILAVVIAAAEACATFPHVGALIQPVRFESADDRGSEIRFVGPRAGQPLGGAAVRLWTRVNNPNPFGLTLSTLRATLYLEESRAAEGEFPLGLPLQAREEVEVPLDLSISFSDVPALASMIGRGLGSPVRYRVDGTFAVEVGQFGSPTFGPMTLFSGQLHGR